MWNFLLTIAILIATSFALLYFFFRRRFEYWKERNIPFEPPTFLFGNFKDVSKTSFAFLVKAFYEKTRHERFYGIWMLYKPTLLINDLELVKNILVKDFMSFHDRGVYYNEEKDPVSAHLFAIEGAKWRNIRAKLTPIFTSGKMKMMFPTMKQCSDELKEVMKKSEGVVEIKDLIARFTTDVIASCAFGIEANSLKNPDAIFRKMGRKITQRSWEMFLRNLGAFLIPDIARFFQMRTIPKKVANFFVDAVRETVNFRESQNVKRNDFLQLLMQLMSKGYVEDVDNPDPGVDKTKFTFEEAVAEAFIFYLGGFEPSSSTMQFILYELALNPEIQEKVREEIMEALAESNGEMTYENVHKLQYMGRVIEETLRKYPAAPFLIRECTKPYRIPDTDITLESGTSIMIPTFGMQMDERFYPNPKKFDPDRFSEEAKAARNRYAYLPFGEGPRVCIGQRFAIMQMRIALFTILSNFKVSVAEGMTPIPLEIDPIVFILTPKGGMHLKISSL